MLPESRWTSSTGPAVAGSWPPAAPLAVVPASPAATGMSAAFAQFSAKPHLRDSTILVVDDEELNVRLLERTLRRAGYTRCYSTGDAREVVGLCEAFHPDLILLDLHLPGMDGFQVMEALRARPRGAEIPILVLSGDDRSEARHRALAGGAKDFLNKPFDAVEVLLRIGNLLEIGALNRELREQNQLLERRVRARTRRLRRDIAKRVEAEAALRTSEAQYRELVESAGDLIYQTDAEGRLLYANPVSARVLGLPAEALLGRRISDLVPDEHRAAAQAFYRHQMEARIPFTYHEMPALSAAGRTVWLGQRVNLVEEGGRVVGMRVIARDMTEIHEVERMKDELVSVVSHELRTPLTSIRASMGLLSGGLLDAYPERARRMVEIASQNADRLIRLVNDILDLERLTSGKVRVEPVPYSLRELVNEALDAVRSTAEKAGVWIVPEYVEQTFCLDPDRICQVLVNLLSNAIKFSSAGDTVWVHTRVEDGTLRMSVRDMGRGIPADKLESIFERFQQVDSSDARQKGGTGLGLAICREIVAQHAGRVWVESAAGEGSTFHVALPPCESRPAGAVVVGE
ncbi:MAG: multi-component transcriptional regulator, winged helix family [Gemmatimonadetes bacterium]|nr:multi-component transcriptional regulator, winged helix family [Gemmatimonadota bacterium]